MLPERVILVYDFGSVNGGAAQVAISSTLELRRRGIQVDYFCAVAPVDARLVEAGVAVTCLHQFDILSNPSRMRAAVSGLWNTPAADAFATLLSTADPSSTLVHVHGWTKALSASIFSVAKRLGFKVVVTLHEYFTACPTGGFFDHALGTVCNRRPMGVDCVLSNCDARSYGQKVWRVARQAVATALTDVHGSLTDVIYISAFSRELLAPYHQASTRWYFVPNPVEADPGARVRAEKNQSMLFIGRLSPEKGCDLFCAAAAAAGSDAVVVGDGPQMAALRAAWPSVHFTGWLDAAGVQAELRKARALVLPSLWYETQGLVVYEALAQGVPVVVADRTAARDAVHDGCNGLLFAQGEVGSLTCALQSLREDSVVQALSEQAHASYWANPPTLQAHCDELLVAYGAVMQRVM